MLSEVAACFQRLCSSQYIFFVGNLTNLTWLPKLGVGEKAWCMFPTRVEVLKFWCASIEIVKKVVEMLL